MRDDDAEFRHDPYALCERTTLVPGERNSRPPGLLVAGRSGRWFVMSGADCVDLRTRKTLATLLRRLGEHRLSAPGDALSPESLIADVWPGERIIPKAARNRLHVAVRSLRAMGLRDVLLFTRHGYMLAPAVPFTFADDPEWTMPSGDL